MNERVRQQTAEMRMAMYRFIAVTAVAFVCLFASLIDAHGARPSAATVISGTETKEAALSASEAPASRAVALLLWVIGNAALIAGMNIAVQGAARQTALRRAAHFWIPSRDSTGPPPPAAATQHLWLLLVYLLCAVVVLVSIAVMSTPLISWCALVAQLAIYLLRCHAWRQ
eukprot:CAMPEP_0174851694 /NCGR_PEP_ID=MMETSP1114-20130205/23402_1 /TAXON_ID=312471 /ORGANISM="Neobodo designis, Strain CCAP 1951/1" /LENGTH=170 /DNA_ID=CAMNT_0016086243 /DNA_START=86 /DNA_END=598 /DNA_ORIENTATION=+